jgi:hypothetical protein
MGLSKAMQRASGMSSNQGTYFHPACATAEALLCDVMIVYHGDT